jgi:hypothetical protein
VISLSALAVIGLFSASRLQGGSSGSMPLHVACRLPPAISIGIKTPYWQKAHSEREY